MQFIARRFREPCGYTLIELLVSIAILGIMASIAGPTVSQSLTEWKVNRFSRSVLTAHRTCRFKAVTYQREIQVRYNIDEDKITFWKNTNTTYDSANDNWVNFTDLTPLHAKDPTDIYSAGDLESGVACMTFKRNGTSTSIYDRTGVSGEGCTKNGTKMGGGVHITWNEVDDSTIDENTTCNWNTIYVVTDNAKPAFMPYGAYPKTSGPFQQWGLGKDEPTCAK